MGKYHPRKADALARNLWISRQTEQQEKGRPKDEVRQLSLLLLLLLVLLIMVALVVLRLLLGSGFGHELFESHEVTLFLWVALSLEKRVSRCT
jgi:hypothetical protein